MAELRKAEVKVEAHSDHFALDALDQDWLREVGAKNWVVLSRDERIRYRPLELQALTQAKVKAFVLVAGNLRGTEMAKILVDALPEIIKTVRENDPPFIAKIYKDSTVKMWHAPAK